VKQVSIAQTQGRTTFDNGLVRVSLDSKGQIVSLVNLADGRDAIAEGHPANVFQMHHDLPVKWDAWDIDAYYRQVQWQLDEVTEVETGNGEDGEAFLRTVRVLSSPGRPNSRIEQRVTLSPNRGDVDLEISVDWHEAEKILKLAFPIDIHCEQAAAETQFGHIWRPTHVNTSWEAAKFEMPQHRFLFLPERDWGVAFANESSYGYDLGRTTNPDGKTITTVRFSLLRSPKFPDPEADQGKHEIRLRIRPGATLQQAVNLGYELNLPIRKFAGGRPLAALITSDSPQCIIEAVKLAEDGGGDLIVRCYEALGGRVRAKLALDGKAAKIQRTNLLEESVEGELATSGSVVELELRPFQIATLRFSGVEV
jgi:alpha-mannosidase